MKAKISSAAAALLWAALVLPAAADLTGPRAGVQTDPTGGVTFVDVKSNPLATSDVFTTTWVLHASSMAPSVGYSGVLFNLSYDGHELSELTLKPVGPHVLLEGPGGGLVPELRFPGSESSPQIVGPIAAYVDPEAIAGSGLALVASEVYPIFQLIGHAKNTTRQFNSDIDITIDPFIIAHVFGTGSLVLPASGWVYQDANGNAAPLGEGTWVHVLDTGPVRVFSSALVAVRTLAFTGLPGEIKNAAGFGIEHVPAPASLGLLALGMGALAIGRWRQRRA